MSKKPKKPRTTTKQAATSQKSSRAVKSGDAEGSKPESADAGVSAPGPTEGVHDLVSDASEAALTSDKEQETRVPASTAASDSTAEVSKARVSDVSEVAPTSERVAQHPVSSAPASHAMQYQSLIPPTDDIDIGWGSDNADDAPASGAPLLATPTNATPASAVEELGQAREPAKAPMVPAPEPEASANAEPDRVSAATTQAESPAREITALEKAEAVTGTAARPSPAFTAPRSLSPATGIGSVRPSAATPSSSRASSPPLAGTTRNTSATRGPDSARGAGSFEGRSGSPVDAGRPSQVPGSLHPNVLSSASESRPSRAPGSLRPAGTSSGSEGHPSRVPAALRPSVAPRAAADAPSAAPQSRATPMVQVTTSTGHEQRDPAKDVASEVKGTIATSATERSQPAAPVSQTKEGVVEAARTPKAPTVSSGAATATPVATEHPLVTAVSPGHEPLQPTVARIESRNDFVVSAAPADAIPSSLPPRMRSRGPLWGLLWLASVAAAGAVGWFAKPVPRPKPVNCDCSTKVESALHEAMLQRARPTEPAAAAPAPSPTLTAAPSEGIGGSESQSATTMASATNPGSTVPVVVETKSDDRIDVLVKSRPSNVKVWRLGRAIGRTPLVIQIGRGEHRMFEVGGPTTGVRRLSLNGEKTEVTVDLIPPGKAAK